MRATSQPVQLSQTSEAPGEASAGDLASSPENGPASLERLHDIVLPPEVSLAPTAPGWYVTGAAALVALALGAWLLVRRRRALRYRAEALRELRAMEARGDATGLPLLLKDVALRLHPRREVASLWGAAWTSFLDRTGGDGLFAAGAGATLVELAYGRSGADPTALFRAAETWLRAQGPER